MIVKKDDSDQPWEERSAPEPGTDRDGFFRDLRKASRPPEKEAQEAEEPTERSEPETRST